MEKIHEHFFVLFCFSFGRNKKDSSLIKKPRNNIIFFTISHPQQTIQHSRFTLNQLFILIMSATATLPKSYKSWVLNEYAKGPINQNTFKLQDVPMPDVNALPADHILIRVQRIAMEPSMRPSISEGKSYREPQALHQPMWAFGIGEVVGSSSEKFQIGQQVASMVNFQEYALIDLNNPAIRTFPVDPRVGLEYLSGLGAPGRAAYWGLIEVARVKEGDVVLVSAAAGATGSVVIQLAKAKGAKQVIGIASKNKQQFVLDQGADVCLDYGASDFAEQLKKVTNEQVTCYFDNTGGAITDAALECMAPHGRIAVCGAIAEYQKMGGENVERHGIKNWRFILTMRLRVEAFVIPDCTPEEHQRTTEQLIGYISKGKLKTQIYTFPKQGVEHCVEALEGLFTGMNTGKMTIKIAD